MSERFMEEYRRWAESPRLSDPVAEILYINMPQMSNPLQNFPLRSIL